MKRERTDQKKIRCSIMFTKEALEKLDIIARNIEGNRSSTIRYLIRKEKA